MSLFKPNLLVSKLIINCNSVSFLCLVSLKLPFKMQTIKSLMLRSSALKCNGSGTSSFCLIECVIIKSVSEITARFSNIYTYINSIYHDNNIYLPS